MNIRGGLVENRVLKNLDVKKLSGSKGLVIFFYPKAGTSGCSLEVAAYNQHLKEFQDLGYNVVGVSNDDEKANDDFSCEKDLAYPLISDLTGEITNQFKVIGEKTSRDGAKQNGIIRSTFVVDPEGKTLVERRNVEPTKHIEELLAKLTK